MSNNSFDAQSLIDLIDKVKMANENNKLTYLCCSEPSEYIKEILKSYGAEYKVIENKFTSSDIETNTAFIIPTH